MDSKIVNREIKNTIWKKLREAGFAVFTSRSAWRHAGEGIDVFNFQSYNSYNAGVLGVTTFSFSVNLGWYPLYIPPQWNPKTKNGLLVPAEYECPFRRRLRRALMQPENKDDGIWSVDTTGENLAWCIGDVEEQIPAALDWFSSFSDKNRVLKLLLEEPQAMRGGTWGFGNNPSPVRSYLAGYVALSLGMTDLAREQLGNAVKSNCFASLFTSVDGAINRAA